MLVRILMVAFALSLAPPAQAELPAGKLDQLRAEAEVVATIQVISVKEEVHGANKDVAVAAKVLGVERSAFGTRKGDEITITYSDPVETLPNSEPMPTLEKDGVYPAFLDRSGANYQPAAWVASFRMTPEGVQAKGNKSRAEELGMAMQAVDRFLKAKPTDPKADELQRAVVGIGQSGEPGGYEWVQARLRYACWYLEARKAELGGHLTEEQVKEIDDRIAFLNRTSVLIDAPR